MYTLRQAIHQRLNEISEERRQLSDERKQLIDMLHGLEDKAGAVDTSSILYTMNQTVQALAELVPQVPASVVIQEIARKVEANEMKVEGVAAIQSKVHEAAVESKLHSPLKKMKNYDSKEIGGLVVAYLREHSGLDTTSNIQKYLEDEHNIYYKDWAQAFYYIRKVEPRIKRSGRGYLMLQDEDVQTYEEGDEAAHGANMDVIEGKE